MVNDPEDPRPSESLSPLFPLMAAFVAVDFLLPVMVRGNESEFLAGVLWGAMLLYGILLLGLGVGFEGPGPDLRAAVAGALILPLLFLGAQVPLWFLRMATGWRIDIDGTQDAGSPRQSRQFGLQHIFGATTAVAVALGLAGLGLPLLEGSDATPDPSVWLGVMFACLIYGVWALLWTLPCLWAGFIARGKAASTAVIGAYVVAMSLLIMIGMSILSSGQFDGAGLAFLVLCVFHGSLAAVLLGSLHLLRYGGYVLLRPGRRQPPATPRCASPLADTCDPSLPSSH